MADTEGGGGGGGGGGSKLRRGFAIFCILLAEFGERFCFSGVRVILTMYLAEGLNYDQSQVAGMLHTFVFTTYCAPFIGAMIADSWFGKYKTIILMSLIYMVGVLVLALGTMEDVNVFKQPTTSYLGMTIVAVAAGSYTACSSSFGGDQFQLPGQEVAIERFFATFYWAISLGRLFSLGLAPEISSRFECVRESSCYPLAFGVPGLFMVAALFFFICATRLYNRRAPETNVFLNFIGCILHAIRNKFTHRDVKKDHWLDHAADVYDQGTINDIKSVFEVMIVLIPVPLFWSLYELQFTGWNYQAGLMDGKVYKGKYFILPYQMQMTNPLTILVLIPLLECIFYPLLRKIHIGTPLQKMCVGMLLAAAAFYVSGTVAYKIESLEHLETMEHGYGQFRFYNPWLNCPMEFYSSHITDGKNVPVGERNFWANTKVRVCKRQNVTYNVTGCKVDNYEGTIELREKKAIGLYFGASDEPRVILDDLKPHEHGWTKVRFLTEYHYLYWDRYKIIQGRGFYHKSRFKQIGYENRIWELKPDTYEVKTGRITTHQLFESGGIYVVLSGNNWLYHWVPKSRLVAKPPERISILLQLPQNVLLAAGEVLFAISGMEFAYTQAPLSMKAVMEAVFLLTYAAGSLIVVIVESLQISYKQSSNYFFYASLMIINALVFACLSIRYTYRQW